MTPRELLAQTRSQLKTAADPDFAVRIRRFSREPLDPYGVPSAKVREIARDVYREVKPWTVADRNRFMLGLWKSGKLEEGAIVCYVYRRFSRQCTEPEFSLFETWLDRYVKDWGHCDAVSTWLLAAAIANRPKLIAKLPPWAKSKNRWKRRAAAVSLIQEAKQGRNTKAIFDICTLLREDEDDLVRKGVGWLLKETYPRRPREVLHFLKAWRTTAPRLVLRYAAEKMTPAHRRWLLKS